MNQLQNSILLKLQNNHTSKVFVPQILKGVKYTHSELQFFQERLLIMILAVLWALSKLSVACFLKRRVKTRSV